MDIEISLPRNSEADVFYDKETGIIKLVPYFHRPGELKTILQVAVKGKTGNEKKSSILVSARTGRVTAHEPKAIETIYDGAVPRKKTKKPPEGGEAGT